MEEFDKFLGDKVRLQRGSYYCTLVGNVKNVQYFVMEKTAAFYDRKSSSRAGNTTLGHFFSCVLFVTHGITFADA